MSYMGRTRRDSPVTRLVEMANLAEKHRLKNADYQPLLQRVRGRKQLYNEITEDAKTEGKPSQQRKRKQTPEGAVFNRKKQKTTDVHFTMMDREKQSQVKARRKQSPEGAVVKCAWLKHPGKTRKKQKNIEDNFAKMDREKQFQVKSRRKQSPDGTLLESEWIKLPWAEDL